MYEQNMEVPRPPGNGYGQDGLRPESNFRGLSDVEKWKKEDLMKKGVLVLILRACALVFSFLSFILMAVIPGFHLASSLSYVFAVAAITLVYSAIQVGIKGEELRTGKEIISRDITVWIDFIGDQILAYLLLSSASTTAMITSGSTPGANPTLDKAVASVVMLFLAFFSIAPAALISGYHLFTVYVLGVAIITMLYTAVQVGIKGHEFRTKTKIITPKIAAWIDFSGDQFLAYMIFSSASVGAAASTGLRKGLLIDAGLELMAASVSMCFFAFLLLAPLTLVSGFRLVTILSVS